MSECCERRFRTSEPDPAIPSPWARMALIPCAPMQISDFDYALPDELIARYPADERRASRLLEVGEKIVDRSFGELPALLTPGDLLVFNDTRVIPARLAAVKDTGGRAEILVERIESEQCALAQVRALNAAGYRPPIELPIRAGGREAIANFRGAMTNMHAGGFISDYDMKIGNHVANALCGGPVDAGTELDEAWYLRYERKGFRSLIKSPKTHARVKHMPDTGKPLRN